MVSGGSSAGRWTKADTDELDWPLLFVPELSGFKVFVRHTQDERLPEDNHSTNPD